MKCVVLPVASVLLLATAAMAAPSSSDSTAIRRFALVASSNDGGPGRARLRFANSDGESMGHVLATLGGVRDADLILVREATRDRLERAFADLRARLDTEKRTQVRREVFVYYSGHSDEEGLLLGKDRVGYRELREWIDHVGADVRIAILDSCASGSLIRLKGGVHRAPFLSDVSTKARGHAFLTASSADEAAQESDRVGSAFFTHFLLSGMRGAADANHDRRVTLNEAYQFAHDETLHRTETSRAGAQHPSYDIQLAGTGDLVMTDLHASSSRLVLAREIAGRIYVRDAAGRLVVELRKEPTYPVELGLESGAYRVVLDHDSQIFEGDFDLPSDGRLDVSAENLAPVAALASELRGGETDQAPATGAPSPAPAQVATAQASTSQGYRHVGFDLVLAPGFRMSGNTGEPVEHGFLLGVLGHSDRVRGAQVSLGGNIAKDGVIGAQVGGMVALSYGPVHGAQISGYNLAMAGLRGAQVGWVASVARGPVHGAQISLVNVVAGSMRGGQIGLANVSRGDFSGAQIGLANVGSSPKGSRGAQIGLANLALGPGANDGPQVGLANLTRGHRGVQIGLVNIADEIDGIQVGLVSVARKHSGASISLIPIVFDGDNRLTLGWNSTTALDLGLKLGTRRFYVVLAMGMTRDKDLAGNREYSASYGFGCHLIPRGGRLLLDLDLVGSSFASASNWKYHRRTVGSLRLQVGYAVAKHLAATFGPTLNVQAANAGDDQSPRGVSWAEHVWTSESEVVRLYPGLIAALEF